MISIPAASFPERYPRSIDLAGGRVFELRLMCRADRDTLIDFGRPRGEVPSLAVDITDPGAIDLWIGDIESGRATTILALERGAVVAYASLHRDGALWKQHAGEVQAMVARSCRGVGLGERMVAEVVLIANGFRLSKVTTGVEASRRSSIAMYEAVGFRSEGLLADYLIDPWDETHDLIIMSCDVARSASTLLAEEVGLLDARPVEEPVTTSTGQREVEVTAGFIEVCAAAAASVDLVEEYTAMEVEAVAAESVDVQAFAKLFTPAAATGGHVEEPAIAMEIDPAVPHAAAAFAEIYAGLRARPREEPALAAAAAMRAVDALAAFAENDASFEATVRPVDESAIIVADPMEAGVVAAFAGTSAPAGVAQTTADDQARAVRLAGDRHAGRLRFRDVALLRAVAAIAVFAAIFSAAALIFYALESRDGGNDSQVLSATERPLHEAAGLPPASFTGSHVGSGRLVVPASAPQVSLRVSLDAATVSGTWFWCFESSFGLTWQEHYCSATAIVDEQMDELLTQGNVRIDPAWPADAVYFIQMYCESDCAWQAEVRLR